MKAVIINQYGSADVLQYTDVETPSLKGNQCLLKVQASNINPIDWKIRKGMLKVLSGNKFPMILGFDVAGEVVAVGENVTQFKPGDAVYAYLDSLSGGAYAEYVAVSEQVACLKPSNMNFEQAAAVPLAATIALQDFTKDSAKYDLIFDVVSDRSFSESKNNLLPQGIYRNPRTKPTQFTRGI